MFSQDYQHNYVNVNIKHLLTIVHLLFTAVQVPTDAGGVVPSAKRILQALDQVTEVVEGLKYLCALVQHRQVHHWLILQMEGQ